MEKQGISGEETVLLSGKSCGGAKSARNIGDHDGMVEGGTW